MKLRWTRLALDDLDRAHEYIAREDVSVAQAIAQRVWDSSRQLIDFPRLGAPLAGDSRLWPVLRTPYILVYRIRDETVEILRVWHSRQDWRSAPGRVEEERGMVKPDVRVHS